MNPNTTARRLLLLATTIHVLGLAIATVSSSSSPMIEDRTFLRSGRKESSLVVGSTTNTKSDTIRRLFFQEKDNLFDATKSQNDYSEDGIGETGIPEPSSNTNMDEPTETAAAAAAPEQSESVLDELDFEDTADSSETKVQTEGQVDTETNSTEPETPTNNTDASEAQDPELEETTAEEKTRKLMNEYVFGTVVAVLVLLYLLYWRDNVVHQKLEFLQKQQEQRDRLKNLQLRASLETEAISLDGSFTNAGMILAEEIRFSPHSPQASEIPKNIMTADRAIDAIRTIGRGGKTTHNTKDRDTSHTEKTALSEIFDLHDDDDDDNEDEYELSSSRRPKSARPNLASEEHWFKYSSSLRSNKGEAFEAKSDSS